MINSLADDTGAFCIAEINKLIKRWKDKDHVISEKYVDASNYFASALRKAVQDIEDALDPVCARCGTKFCFDGYDRGWGVFVAQRLVQHIPQLLGKTTDYCKECFPEIVKKIPKIVDVLETKYAVNNLERAIKCKKTNDQQTKLKLLDSFDKCLSTQLKEF